MIVKTVFIVVFGTQKEVYTGAGLENLTEAKPKNSITACKRWNEYMLFQSGIEKDSRVLDLVCGNGNTAIWLSQQTGCELVGVDLSSVRIENAKTKEQQYPSLRLKFIKA
jgi:Methylase involved in ubiquinone/menaquinone biosynthesis